MPNIIDTVFSPAETVAPEVDIFDTVGPQSTEDCEVMCERRILHQFGIDLSEEDLLNEAVAKNYWNNGTPIEHVGNLVSDHGLQMETSTGCNMDDLVNEISQGHKVIVAVDSSELMASPGFEMFTEQLTEIFQGDGSDHAIEVESVDLENGVVTIYNPATGAIHGISIDRFEAAWDNGVMSHTNASPSDYGMPNETITMDMDKFMDLQETMQVHCIDGKVMPASEFFNMNGAPGAMNAVPDTANAVPGPADTPENMFQNAFVGDNQFSADGMDSAQAVADFEAMNIDVESIMDTATEIDEMFQDDPAMQNRLLEIVSDPDFELVDTNADGVINGEDLINELDAGLQVTGNVPVVDENSLFDTNVEIVDYLDSVGGTEAVEEYIDIVSDPNFELTDTNADGVIDGEDLVNTLTYEE